MYFKKQKKQIAMKNFKETVQAMTAKGIIMAMVNGLTKEWVKIHMETFGNLVSCIILQPSNKYKKTLNGF